MQTLTANIEDFAHQAREFVSLMTRPGPMPSDEAPKLTHHLARLYMLAFELPRLEPGDGDTERVILKFPSTFALGAQLYATTVDVLDLTSSSSCGDLDDDLRDIALDLAHGLAAYDAGNAAEGAWLWKFSFESHWGTHLVEALRVLHRLGPR